MNSSKPRLKLHYMSQMQISLVTAFVTMQDGKCLIRLFKMVVPFQF